MSVDGDIADKVLHLFSEGQLWKCKSHNGLDRFAGADPSSVESTVKIDPAVELCGPSSIALALEPMRHSTGSMTFLEETLNLLESNLKGHEDRGRTSESAV